MGGHTTLPAVVQKLFNCVPVLYHILLVGTYLAAIFGPMYPLQSGWLGDPRHHRPQAVPGRNETTMTTTIHHTKDVITLIDNGKDRYCNADTVTAHPKKEGVTVAFSRTYGSSHCLFLRGYTMQEVIDLADGEEEESLQSLIESRGGCCLQCDCDHCQNHECDCESCSSEE